MYPWSLIDLEMETHPPTNGCSSNERVRNEGDVHAIVAWYNGPTGLAPSLRAEPSKAPLVLEYE